MQALRGRQGARGGTARAEPERRRCHAPARERDGVTAGPGWRDRSDRRGAQGQPRQQPRDAHPGSVRLQTGQAKDAEAAFRNAIALDPSSVDARLAFASFLMASERLTEAEATLKEVIGKDPQHLLANRMLAVVYLTTKRPAEAEQPLKAVADVSKSPAARFRLADYYVATGRTTGRHEYPEPPLCRSSNVRRGGVEACDGRSHRRARGRSVQAT